ncbi:Uncharacterized protein Rs2_02957 [Raphanus sativus]|nr:Uncharacterized protein Rs2_02957 [Raphanus sativus]
MSYLRTVVRSQKIWLRHQREGKVNLKPLFSIRDLTEEILDEADEYMNIHNRIRVNNKHACFSGEPTKRDNLDYNHHLVPLAKAHQRQTSQEYLQFRVLQESH